MNDGKIQNSQLQATLFTALFFDALVSLWNTAELPSAKNMVFAIALNSLLLFVLLLPLGFWYRKKGKCCEAGDPPVFLRCLGAFFFLALEAESALRTVSFYLKAEQRGSNEALFVFFFCAAAFYVAYLGNEALVRGSGILLILGLLSFAGVLISNFSGAHLENLDISAVQIKTVAGFALSHPLPIAPFIAVFSLSGQVAGKRTSFSRQCVGLFLVLTSLILVAELVLGSFLKVSSIPVLYLSQIGSLSVFERFDAVYGSLFTLCGFAKCALYACAAWQLAAPLFKKENQLFFLCCGAVFGAFAAMALKQLPALPVYLALQITCAAAALGLPLIASLKNRSEKP